jgi:hypothetical protein
MPTEKDFRFPAEFRKALRDYFAAKALQGLLAAPDVEGEPAIFARGAYMHADAMLKAREA